MPLKQACNWNGNGMSFLHMHYRAGSSSSVEASDGAASAGIKAFQQPCLPPTRQQAMLRGQTAGIDGWRLCRYGAQKPPL